MWKACFILVLCLASVLVVCARARPQDKSRVVEGRLSDEKHFEGEEHNVEYDHEAFLGKDKKTFDQLSTEESVERLGLLVDGKIDKNRDGKVTKDELKDWIKFASKRYIYEDVDRQWDHLKKLTESRLTSQGLPVEKGSTDAKSPIGWMEYRNNTYGYVSNDPERADEFNYKEMIKRDKNRWEYADQNKDGMLTKEEYTAFLHPEEFDHMKGVVVDETLEDIDKDKDGVISLEEYIGDLYPESESKENKEDPEWVKTERDQFFSFRDKNKDGKMDREEVRDWVIPADYDHVESETTHLIHEADENKDGELTRDEIVKKHDIFVGSQATDFGEALTRNHDEF